MRTKLLIYNPSAEEYRRPLVDLFPQLEIATATSAAEAAGQVADAEILFLADPSANAGVFQAGTRLRWVQVLTTGTDGVQRALGDRRLHLTAARGFHGPQMSEQAFFFMLALTRNVRSLLRDQADGAWRREEPELLWRKTAVIVGVGVIAEALAARLKAFDMRVVGISATQREVPHFDAVRPREDIALAFAEADYVIVLSSYTRGSHRLVDRAALSALKPTAYFLNLARGGVIDEDALFAMLRDGRLAGAGLDVFATEPLPADSPLRRLPNVILTPHTGGMARAYREQVLPILEENLSLYLAGHPERLRFPVTRDIPA